jgi:hypothetical protein
MLEESEDVGVAECSPDRFGACAWYTASTSLNMSSLGTPIGNGTEQQESTTLLGRPVMILRVRSSEYKLHHIWINDSRWRTVAVGTSLRTWSPSA